MEATEHKTMLVILEVAWKSSYGVSLVVHLDLFQVVSLFVKK